MPRAQTMAFLARVDSEMFRLQPVQVGVGIRVVTGHRHGGFAWSWLVAHRFPSLPVVKNLKSEEIQLVNS